MSENTEPRIIINLQPLQVAAAVIQEPSVIQPIGMSFEIIPPGYEDMSNPMSFLGLEPEKVRSLSTTTLTLDDTSYGAWSASTTASTIYNNSAIYDSEVLDCSVYDYVILWTTTTEVAYNTGATLKAMPRIFISQAYQEIVRYPSSLTNLRNDNYNSSTYVNVRTEPIYYYYNTSGNLAMTYTSYGVYSALVAPTFTNGSTVTPTLNIKLPTLSARCHASYFAVARKPEVDTTNTQVTLQGEIWRFRAGTLLAQKAKHIVSNLLLSKI